MANRSRAIALSGNDRKELERFVRASSTLAGLSRRARAILLMAEGFSGVQVADKTGYTNVQVSRIRRRFAEEGIAGLHERERSGRPPSITPRKRAQVVAKTLKKPKRGITHWTTRDMAREVGISHSSVQRIWIAHALQPHRVQTFKFTTDPDAEEKIHDVVGLYLDRPIMPSCCLLTRKPRSKHSLAANLCSPFAPDFPNAGPTITNATALQVSTPRSKSQTAASWRMSRN